MKKKRVWITVLSVVLIAALGAGGLSYGLKHRSKGTAEVYPVNMISTQNWNDDRSTYGQVQTGMIQQIYLDGSSVVKEVFVSEGDPVKIGDPIIAYDTTMLELSLERQRLGIQSKELAQELLMKEIEKWHSYAPSYISRIDTGEGTDSSVPTEPNVNPSDEDHTNDSLPETDPPGGGTDTKDSSSQPESSSESSTESSSESSTESSPESSQESSSESSQESSSESSQESSSESSQESSSESSQESSSEPSSESSGESSSESSGESSSESSNESSSESSKQEESSVPVEPEKDPTKPDKDLEPGTVILMGGAGTKEDPLQAVVYQGACDLTAAEFEKVRGKVVRFSVQTKPSSEKANDSKEVYAVLADLTAAEALAEGRIFSLKVTFQQIRSTVGVLTVYQLKFPGAVTIFYPLPTGTQTLDMSITGVGENAAYTKSVNVSDMKAAFDIGQIGGLFVETASEPEPEREPEPEDSVISEDSELPEESEISEESLEPIPEPNYDPGYSYDEIIAKLKEKEAEYIEKSIDLKLDKIEYQKAQKQFESLTVRSQVEGYVKSVGNPEELMGGPYIVLSASDGYFVTGTMSELQIEQAKFGQNVIISSWMSGMQYTGTIVKVGDYPMGSGYYNGNGNPNASYYEFTARIDAQPGEELQLQNGEGVDIKILQETQVDAESFYIPNMYIRTENGESYVMKRGEDGLLVKQVIVKGGSLWGSYTEVKEGLTQDDFVAFPYSVSEGMETKVVEGYGFY